MYTEMITAYVQSHREEIVETLKSLVRIPSVEGTPAKDAPFGRECAAILRATEALYSTKGFKTALYADSGYLLAEGGGDGDKSIGLFAHGDVVPVSDDWVLTDPFTPIEKDGFLVGRGVEDNKSGIVASLFAMRALRDLGIPVKSRIVAFTGSNEESGMCDIDAYVHKHRIPDLSLVADCAFPVYRGEKGVFRFVANAKTRATDILDATGGQAFNIVLGDVALRLRYSDALDLYLSSQKKDSFTVTRDGDALVLRAFGRSRHAAMPEGSLNAMYVAASLLKDAPIADSDRTLMRSVADMLAVYDGSALGIKRDYADFGALTATNGIVRMENGILSLSFDTRYGAGDGKDLEIAVAERLAAYGFAYEGKEINPGYLTPADHPAVLALIAAYREVTGDEKGQSCLSAGGTYARHLTNAFPTGTTLFPPIPFSLPDGHGGVHQPDECISIDSLLTGIVITANMILACDKVNQNA